MKNRCKIEIENAICLFNCTKHTSAQFGQVKRGIIERLY